MSKTAKSTAVNPSKYLFSELENVDPRFYVEKDLVVLVPFDMQEASIPEQAVIMNTSVESKTLMLMQGVLFDENVKPPKSFKNGVEK